MYHASRRTAALVVAAAALTTVTACSSGSSTSSPAASTSASTSASSGASGGSSVSSASSGVTVAGGFGATPKVTIPGGAAPTALTAQTLVQGTGAPVSAGDTLVANYVGETWANKKVFDSSFTRGAPAGFTIGEGRVIPGWDKALVGKKIGSRVLLTIPPADGYGANGNPQAGISGTDTLVFVVDLVAAYKPTASAPGTAVGGLPAGWPKVSDKPATKPVISSVAGVKAPKKPVSKLIVKGSGAAIDPSKSLVLQIVRTDLATGKKTDATWDQAAPPVVTAQNVLSVASALKGQRVGSRAVVLVPAAKANPATGSSATPAEVLVIDVVGQF